MSPLELRSFRKRKEFTQGDLADWLKVSKRTVVAWEGKQNPIPAWVADKISGDGFRLNPKLDYEKFQRVQIAAGEAGQSMDEWVAAVIEKELALAPKSKSSAGKERKRS